jgi:hypothetical protein
MILRHLRGLHSLSLIALTSIESLLRMDISGRWTCVSLLEDWRPVQESNPCYRREREAIHGNSNGTSRHGWQVAAFEGLRGYSYWTFNGRANDRMLPVITLTAEQRIFLLRFENVFGIAF